MQNYERAVNKFYSTQGFKALPLDAWDMFAEKYVKFCQDLEEVSKLKELAQKEGWNDQAFFETEILHKNHIVVVTDSRLTIVHATKNIFHMNGYHPEEIIGKTPKIFQGKGTSKHTVSKIGEAIHNLRPFEATVTNYRKDGTPYKCWIKACPVKNRKGKVVNFIAFEREVA